MEKVTGVGGVFIKAKDTKALAEWYQKNLGIEFGGKSFFDFNQTGHTVFSFFKEDSKYFQPSEKPYMINFHVKNLSALMEELKKEKVEIIGFEEHEYGKFGWILDPEGNKIELWEPAEEKE